MGLELWLLHQRNKWPRVDSLDVDDDLEVVEGMEGSGVGGKGEKDAEMKPSTTSGQKITTKVKDQMEVAEDDNNGKEG